MAGLALVVVDVCDGDGEGVGARHGLGAALAPHVPHDDGDVVVLLLLPVEDGLGGDGGRAIASVPACVGRVINRYRFLPHCTVCTVLCTQRVLFCSTTVLTRLATSWGGVDSDG